MLLPSYPKDQGIESMSAGRTHACIKGGDVASGFVMTSKFTLYVMGTRLLDGMGVAPDPQRT